MAQKLFAPSIVRKEPEITYEAAVISGHLNGEQPKHDESDEAQESADLQKPAPLPVPRPRLFTFVA